MDPVSRLLVERERALPRLTPWIVMALLGHGVCVAAAIWLGREPSTRPGHLPAVSVRLVRPQVAAAKPQAGPSPQEQRTLSKPAAEQVSEPEPPEVELTPPKPAEIKPSDQAMPATDAEPQPTPAPSPQASQPTADTQAAAAGSSTEAGTRRSGLSLGGSGTGTPSGIPSDFEFTYYVERMLSLIESKWYRPPVPPETRAQVRFSITKRGRLEGIQLESSSGVSSFDRAVLRALYAANPLPPLPPAYRKPSLTVHLTFSQ